MPNASPASLIPPRAARPEPNGSNNPEVIEYHPRAVPPTSETRPRVLAAVPCYNEELTVAGLALRARRHVDQVVVIDDGSTDRTAENAYLAEAIVLQHAHNLGKGAALRTAFRYAAANGFDALVLLDGDGQHDPDEIPLVLVPVLREENPVDIALGFRYGSNTEMPAYRRVGKRVLDYATAATAGAEVTDSQCGFRAFSARAIKVLSERLLSEKFAVESETLAIAHDVGLKTANVAVHCRYDDLDTSTKNPMAHGVSVLEGIVVLLTMRRPLLTVGLPGLAFTIWGAWWGFRMLQVYDKTGNFLLSYAMAAATMLILGGIMIATALMLNMMILMRKAFPQGGR